MTCGFVPGCDRVILDVSIVGTGILAIVVELIIVAPVEKVDEAGDAGFGVDGEVDDAFLGFLDSEISLGVG